MARHIQDYSVHTHVGTNTATLFFMKGNVIVANIKSVYAILNTQTGQRTGVPDPCQCTERNGTSDRHTHSHKNTHTCHSVCFNTPIIQHDSPED